MIFSMNPYIRKYSKMMKSNKTEFRRKELNGQGFLIYLLGNRFIKSSRGAVTLYNGHLCFEQVIESNSDNSFKIEMYYFLKKIYSLTPFSVLSQISFRFNYISYFKKRKIRKLFNSTLMEIYREELTVLFELYDSYSRVGNIEEMYNIRCKVHIIFSDTIQEIVSFIDTCVQANEATTNDNISSLINDLDNLQRSSELKISKSTIRNKNNKLKEIMERG